MQQRLGHAHATGGEIEDVGFEPDRLPGCVKRGFQRRKILGAAFEQVQPVARQRWQSGRIGHVRTGIRDQRQVVRHAPPDAAARDFHPHRLQAPRIHVVELGQRQPGRVGGQPLICKIGQAQRQHRGPQAGIPVVEIPGHQERCVRGNFARNKTLQLRNLAAAAGGNEPEMEHDHMHRTALHLHLHMQQTPLFETVVGHVLVGMGLHRPARQQRIAMLAMAGEGIGLVHRLVALGRQEFGLGQFGPAREMLLLAPVQLAHLLQAHDVGVELLDAWPRLWISSRRRGPRPCTPLWML